MTGEGFGALHAAMQRLVDTEILAGVSSAVLVNGRIADLYCTGWADREARIALRPEKGYGLAGAVTLRPSPDDPPQSTGDLEWGGIAGTHWWVSPTRGIAGIVMAQRQWAFWHPFSLELKRLACQAALAQCPR